MEAQLTGMFHEAAASLTTASHKAGIPGLHPVVVSLATINSDDASNEHGLNSVVSTIHEFQATVEKALSDPSSLVPGGHCAAGIAKMYAAAVAAKLNLIKTEGMAILELFQALAQHMAIVFQGVADTVKNALPCIVREVKELMDLPKVLMQIAQNIEKGGFSAIANLDMSGITRSLDVSPIKAPLQKIEGMKVNLAAPIVELQQAMLKLTDFKNKVPNKVVEAFAGIGCFAFFSHGTPDIQKEMLSHLDVLKGINLSPLVDVLNKLKFLISNFDTTAVSDNLTKYSNQALQQTSTLTQAIEQAKQEAGMAMHAAAQAEALAAQAQAAAAQAQAATANLMHGDPKAAMNMIGSFF